MLPTVLLLVVTFLQNCLPKKTPGATGQSQDVAQADFNLAEQEVDLGEQFYQQLKTKLATEISDLEAANSEAKSISATVDGFSFNEDFVNIEQNQISFQQSHGFTTGDKVIYRAGQNNGVIGGLTEGESYFAIAIDSETIQLSATPNGDAVNFTSAGTGNHQLLEVIEFSANNQIKIDTEQDLIYFDTPHGLTNISTVRYDAGNNSSIGGLSNGRDYTVRVVNSTTVRLRDLVGSQLVDLIADSSGNHSFTPVIRNSVANDNGGVNVNQDTIAFATPHNLQTGDRIQYYKPVRGRAVGGTLDKLLTKQTVFPYTVVKVSDTEIKLQKDGKVLDLTSAGSGLHTMTSLESNRTFQTRSNIQFVNDTTIKLGYSHGLTTGQTVSLQLDPTASYAKTPIAGLNAIAYNPPTGHRAKDESIYHVKVANNGNLRFAETAEDLANNNFVSLQRPSKGSRFRFMPTWSFGSVALPATREQLGNAVSFSAANDIQVDVNEDKIILPSTELEVGEAVKYRSNSAIGGLNNGDTYYVASNFNGNIQLSATLGGEIVDLTSDGSGGDHSFVRQGVNFLANNNIAQKRRAAGVQLQDRLSRDLGMEVSLTAGDAAEATTEAERGVSFHNIAIAYDEEQVAQTKLLAGINNAYSFLGSDFQGADETGVKVTNGNLGLVLYKTIDYRQSDQPEMTYALSGDGEAALVGVDDITLDGTLAVNLNRTGTTIDETITTPNGEIAVGFDSEIDITQLSGTSNLKLADAAAISGTFDFTKDDKGIQVDASNISAFVGIGADTDDTKDDTGLSIDNGSFDFTLNTDDTYSYNINGDVAAEGIDLFEFSGKAVATGDNNNVSVALEDLDLAVSDYARVSGNFNFSVSSENDTQIIDLAANGADAFFGTGADTKNNTDDDLGLGLSNVSGNLQIRKPQNGKEFIAYDLGGNVAANIPGFTLNGQVKAQYNDAAFDVTLGDATLASGINRVSGTGINLNITALESAGLQGQITTDAVFDLQDNGAIFAGLNNVNASVSINGATVGSVDGSENSTGTLTGEIENGSLGLVLLADGKYALKGSATANLSLGDAIVGGDVGIELVNLNGDNSEFTINQTIELDNQAIRSSL